MIREYKSNQEGETVYKTAMERQTTIILEKDCIYSMSNKCNMIIKQQGYILCILLIFPLV